MYAPGSCPHRATVSVREVWRLSACFLRFPQVNQHVFQQQFITRLLIAESRDKPEHVKLVRHILVFVMLKAWRSCPGLSVGGGRQDLQGENNCTSEQCQTCEKKALYARSVDRQQPISVRQCSGGGSGGFPADTH
jgi:hypothetical protein